MTDRVRRGLKLTATALAIGVLAGACICRTEYTEVLHGAVTKRDVRYGLRWPGDTDDSVPDRLYRPPPTPGSGYSYTVAARRVCAFGLVDRTGGGWTTVCVNIQPTP